MSAGSYLRWTIGSWRLVDFLGAGGMGEVYRAVHLHTGRVAALKILNNSADSPSFVQRFHNEARILSTLQHRHIAAWYETLETEGRPCIAMEYVTGDTLEHRLRRGPLRATEALRLFADLTDAVAYIHDRGIVHRDLKANNVKIDEQGTLKLLDFGIAKAGDSPKLTTDGSVVGTLHYLSPEQVRGEPASPASDVWALGVMLYETVTGEVPFAGNSFTVVMARILKGSYDPPSARRSDIPKDVERLIARCLRVDPKDRPESAAALHEEVRRLVAPAPMPVLSRTSRYWRRWPLIASVAATAGAAVYLWASTNCCAPRPIDPRDLPIPPDTVATNSAPTNPGERTKGEMRPVVIKIFEGTADVLRDGRVIGQTPLEFTVPVGAWVNLTLRQPGFDDLTQRFQVGEGRNQYQYAMQRSATATPAPRDDAPANAAAFLEGL